MNISDRTGELIRHCSNRGVLKFCNEKGFKLKSGRHSPWFFQCGELMSDGQGLCLTAELMSEEVIKILGNTTPKNTILYGPAYKGIPLASTTAVKYYERTGKNIGFSSHRKEAKTRGEGGTQIGQSVEDKEVIIIDDVITGGTAFKEAKRNIEQAGGQVKSVLTILDRQELSEVGDKICISKKIAQENGIPILSILTYNNIQAAVREGIIGNREIGAAMDRYFREYGDQM